MDPETDFYQISGYRAHSNRWFKMFDDKPMMDAILAMKTKLFRPQGCETPIELVLGILPSGASYLLMTSEQMQEFTLKHRLPIHTGRDQSPWRSTDFLSLSPIYFSSREELAAKVSSYKQRPRNNSRRESGEPLDNSQANRGYVRTAGSDVVHYRGYFEQQRTLFRLLTGDLQSDKVGLLAPPWLGGIRIVSLVFEEWAADNRPHVERLNDPVLIHVGWTDALLPSFIAQPTGSTVHLNLDTQGKRNPGTRKPFLSQLVEHKVPKEGLYARLRDLFSHDTNKSNIPLIVIVHDERMARGILGRAGINVDAWSSGLFKLLPRAPRRSRRKAEEEEPFDPTILPGPTIVDIQKLVKAVMETSPGNTVPHSAKVLRMQTGTRTCAGDDSLVQLHMWTSMAQGLAVDEQHKQRLSHQPDCAQLLAPPQQQASANGANANDDDDEEGDPNDYNPNEAPRGPGPRPTAADDFSDSDDDWE